MGNDEVFRCRVCGLKQEDPPWGEDGRSPNFSFCPCCEVEFGYGDATIIAIQRWRKKWLENGAKWSEIGMKPKVWSFKEQLSRIPEEFKDSE